MKIKDIKTQKDRLLLNTSVKNASCHSAATALPEAERKTKMRSNLEERLRQSKEWSCSKTKNSLLRLTESFIFKTE